MSEDARKLVLLADDDPEIRHLVRLALNRLEVDFIDAEDGEQALEQILVNQPDLVVLDVRMPGLTGWEICKYVRSKPELSAVAVLMLTSIGPLMNAMTSPLYGADAYLDKPFDIEEIIEVASRLLEEGRPETPPELPKGLD